MDQDIIKATPASRVKLAGILVFLLAFGAVAAFLFFPWLRAADPASPAEAGWYIKVTLHSLALVLMVFATFAFLLGRKLFRYNQSPPPGAWVFRDVPVVRGKMLRVRAIVFICSAVLLTAASIYSVVLASRLAG